MSDVTLKEHFETRLAAVEKATEVAAKQMEKRLDSMNEFREQLRCQASLFMTKENYDARHQLLQNQVDDLMLSRAELKGKASMSSVYMAYAIAIISIGLSIISCVHGFMK